MTFRPQCCKFCQHNEGTACVGCKLSNSVCLHRNNIPTSDCFVVCTMVEATEDQELPCFSGNDSAVDVKLLVFNCPRIIFYDEEYRPKYSGCKTRIFCVSFVHKLVRDCKRKGSSAFSRKGARHTNNPVNVPFPSHRTHTTHASSVGKVFAWPVYSKRELRLLFNRDLIED